MRKQNTLIAAAAVAISATSAAFGQWTQGNPQGGNANWGGTPQLYAPPLFGQPQYQTDGGVGAIAAAIAEERELQAQRVQQQMQWTAEQIARQRNETIALKLMAAKNGMVIDNSNSFNPKVLPAAEYRAQQELKEAGRRPIEVFDLDAKSQANYPNVRAFTTFYERKSGGRIRELNRAAKSMGATRWHEDSRKPYRDCWLVTVSFYRR